MKTLTQYLDEVKARREKADGYALRSDEDDVLVYTDLPRLERWLREAVGLMRQIVDVKHADAAIYRDNIGLFLALIEEEARSFLARVEKEVGDV